MKTILILCGLILAGVIAWILIARPFADHYGNDFGGREAVELARLLDHPSDYLKKDVRIEGTLARECPCCGCWFVLRDSGGRELRVETGDTLGHLPLRLGRKTTVEGELIRYGEGYEFIGTAVEFH